MKKAFTLIELLVVIAIIAILAAILFPVFASAKSAAKKTVDLSNVKQLMTGVLIYSNDTDDASIYMPYAAFTAPQPQALWWTDQIMPYVKSKDIFSSPGANGIAVYAPPTAYRYPGTTEDYATQAQIVAQGYRVNYTLNQVLSKADDSNPFAAGHFTPDIFSSIDKPADTVYIGPGLDWFEWSACQYAASGSQQVDLYWNSSLESSAPGSWGWGYETFNMDGDPSHAGYNGGANFAFCDGHAKFSRMVKGGDLVWPDPAGFGGLEAGWYPFARTYENAGTGAAGCPSNDMTTFEASH